MARYQFASLAEFTKIREEIKNAISSFCPRDGELLYVALNEAVNNALFHGQKDGLAPNVEVNLFHEVGEVRVVVKHDGSCFEQPSSENQATDNYDEHGRGLEIIAYCTDYFCFNSCGNELEMRKKIV